jgi:2'-5' RNA ligase
MQGLVSIIPEPFYQQIEEIWNDLESRFGLVGFLVSAIPHFSWHIAEQYDPEQVEESIQTVLESIQPFQIRTVGIGLFTGVRKIVYVPINKDCRLIDIHQRIWQAAQPISQGSNHLYSPINWVPHITLIHENITQEKIGPVMKYLAEKTYAWEITIDQLAWITDKFDAGNCVQVKASYPIGK